MAPKPIPDGGIGPFGEFLIYLGLVVLLGVIVYFAVAS